MTPSEERAVGGIYPRVGGDLKISPDKGIKGFQCSHSLVEKQLPPKE